MLNDQNEASLMTRREKILKFIKESDIPFHLMGEKYLNPESQVDYYEFIIDEKYKDKLTPFMSDFGFMLITSPAHLRNITAVCNLQPMAGPPIDNMLTKGFGKFPMYNNTRILYGGEGFNFCFTNDIEKSLLTQKIMKELPVEFRSLGNPPEINIYNIIFHTLSKSKEIEIPKPAIKMQKGTEEPKLYDKPISILKLSARTTKILNENKILQIRDLINYTQHDLLKIPGIGKIMTAKIWQALNNFSLSLKQ